MHVGMAVSVHQTACLGRINTGLQKNPSLQTLFLSVYNPEVLKVFPHVVISELSSLAVRQANNLLLLSTTFEHKTTCQKQDNQIKFQMSTLSCRSSFWIHVRVLKTSSGCHHEVCPGRQWKNKTDEQGKACSTSQNKRSTLQPPVT